MVKRRLNLFFEEKMKKEGPRERIPGKKREKRIGETTSLRRETYYNREERRGKLLV